MGAAAKSRALDAVAHALPPRLGQALAGILPAGAMRALTRAVHDGDQAGIEQALQPEIARVAEGSRRQQLLSWALVLLLGSAAYAIASIPPTRESQTRTQERLFPTAHIGQPAPFNPLTAPPPDWAAYVARLGPSAASATTVGVPETPTHLLRRLQEYQATGRGDERDLGAAVAFWNAYWADKYAPLLRWVRSAANRSVLDTMTEAEADKQGRGQLFRARRRVVQTTDRAIQRHFAFFDGLKRAVQGTPLQAALTAYSDRATEWELARVEKGVPGRAAYLDPAFPPVNDPSEALPAAAGGSAGAGADADADADAGPAAADPFLAAAPHATLAARHAKAGALHEVGPMAAGSHAPAYPHLRESALLCGGLAEYCSDMGMTDAKAAAIRAIWDTQAYASAVFGQNAAAVLQAIHMDSPVHIVAEMLPFDNGSFSALGGTPAEMVARELRAGRRGHDGRAKDATKVVVSLGVSAHGFGHAEVLVVDLVNRDVRVFDPHGRLLLDAVDPSGRAVAGFQAALQQLVQDPLVVAATGGEPLHVPDVKAAALDMVSRFAQMARLNHVAPPPGPQGLQGQRGTSFHEGSCQLWSLWFTHLVAQYPTLTLDRVLATGVRSILENADVSDDLVAKVLEPAGGPALLTPAERVRVGDVMTRFIHRFTTQLMSFMPMHMLEWHHSSAVAAFARVLAGSRPTVAPGEASTFATGRVATAGRPKDNRQRVRDILATLAPPAGAAVTEPNLHRLWRLRQGLRSPRYVDAAATEAFGPFHAGREEQVLRFLDATRFLDKMHEQGADLGPTLSSSPGGLTGWLHRTWGAVAGRSSDSYRGEVPTGTFP
jgi:hypothetical protein